jgi:hypothetical protein
VIDSLYLHYIGLRDEKNRLKHNILGSQRLPEGPRSPRGSQKLQRLPEPSWSFPGYNPIR